MYQNKDLNDCIKEDENNDCVIEERIYNHGNYVIEEEDEYVDIEEEENMIYDENGMPIYDEEEDLIEMRRIVSEKLLNKNLSELSFESSIYSKNSSELLKKNTSDISLKKKKFKFK